MRFSLRTLLIVLALAPPLMALVWLYPWLVLCILGLAALQAVYLLVIPYCLAWLVSAVAELIARIPGQD